MSSKSRLRTIVFVAAGLAASPVFAAIHLVNCDTGPFLTITDALAAATNGDSIIVEECSQPYAENVIIDGFDGLDLVGASKNVYGAKPAGVGSGHRPAAILTGTGFDDCLVIGSSTNILVQNIFFAGCGVYITGTTDVTLLANRIASGVGIMLSDRLRITGNVIVGSLHNGLTFESMYDVFIHDNLIAFSAGHGILFDGVQGCRVENNQIVFSENNGIQGHCSLGDLFVTRITRNSFFGSGGVDISTSGEATQVIGNSVPGGMDLGPEVESAHNY